MLSIPYGPPALPAPRPGAGVARAHIRRARAGDWPRVRALLLRAGLSLTGLEDRPEALLLLERTTSVGAGRVLLGCVAVEEGRPALIRSLAVRPRAPLAAYDLLLDAALRRAGAAGDPEPVLLVETTNQLPAQHGGRVFWEHLRILRPQSLIVRELGTFDSSAVAVRLPAAPGAA